MNDPTSEIQDDRDAVIADIDELIVTSEGWLRHMNAIRDTIGAEKVSTALAAARKLRAAQIEFNEASRALEAHEQTMQ